jgi:osmoprotectant transport system substrate-binding protein
VRWHSAPDRAIGAISAIVVASPLLVTGCTDDEGGFDFSGVEITVGSRDFTEQYVLSGILIEALERFGAEVHDATDTGDIVTTRAAIESGEIDAYWEYNSAALVEVFGAPSDPDDDGEELTDEARDLDAENSITWVGRSTFNNTYGFALTPELAEEHQSTRYSVQAFDLDELADLLEDDDDLLVCVEEAFVDRVDGLALFEEQTGFTIPDEQLRILASTGEIYPLLREGDCDVGEVFTTDAQIAELDLDVVEDRGVFLVYNASLTIRDDAYEQAPDEFDRLVDDILGALSQTRMTELNGRVAAGEPVAEVADEFVDEFVDR